MTVTLALVAMAALTAYLLIEDWFFQRRINRLAARRTPPPMRCLVCPNAPVVEDFRTHSRLVHQPRVTAPEDHGSWMGRSA